MKGANAAVEDWDLLTSFFPQDWKEQAKRTNALKGLRQDKSEEHYLRVLLLHLGCGFSMRETVARARQAKLADLSDVALLKRLRKSHLWLYQLCSALFAERDIKPKTDARTVLRLVDSTLVKEPGQTGSLWRVHYSLRWPTMVCDFFKLTPTEGDESGESLRQYPVARGDLVLADRGYCHAAGIHFVAACGAYVTVRLNSQSIILHTVKGAAFPLLQKLRPIQRTGQIISWPVLIPCADRSPVAARLCVIRKSKTAIALAVRKLKRKASKAGSQLQPETLVYAEYVMVLTTFPPDIFPPALILEYYRCRWQIELVFKRFKQIAQLGHLPKYNDDSAKAWLYGKLFVALITEKIIRHARAFSPWGYDLDERSHAESLA